MVTARWTIAAGLLMGASVPASGQQRIERRMAADPHTSVRLHNLTGSTTVIGWDRDSVVLTGTIPQGAQFFFGGTPGGMKGSIDLPAGADALPAHVELRVPRGARVWIKSAGADVTVRDVTGGIDLYAVSGRLVVQGAAEELNAESMDGAVTVDAGRWTRVKTASGAVEVRGGEDVGINTVTGSVTYLGDAFRRARLESVSGNLRYAGAPPRSARLEVESHSGRIVLELPATVSAAFAITVFSGGVRNAFGSQSLRPGPDLRGRTLDFAVGGGAADIVIRSFKGDVELVRGK
jgi:hypothetical protein